jgi:hypothetical protein
MKRCTFLIWISWHLEVKQVHFNNDSLLVFGNILRSTPSATDESRLPMLKKPFN